MSITLYNGDCLEEMKNIPDVLIDLILIDPPYVISKDSGFNSGDLKKFTSYKTYFGDWDKKEYTILDDVFSVLSEKLKNGGTIICFYDLWKITHLKDVMEKNNFKQIRFIEWLKTNPVPVNSKKNYLTNAREVALSCVKKSNPTFNSKYDNGIYEYPICHDKDRFHPTQKPVKLMEDIIKKHSNAGDTVLDCFMGSGSTGVACINQGRNFIGIEKDPELFRKAKERLTKSNL